jgi:hypothetical protein
MNNFTDGIPVSVEGYVVITDLETGQVLCAERNAIHKENMGFAISEALATGNIISEIHFGNGGTLTTETGLNEFRPANIIGKDAELYNAIYYRIVDPLDFQNSDPANNKVEVRHVNGTTYTDIVVTTTLDYADPDENGTGGGFVKSLSTAPLEEQAKDGSMRFDEIGLKSRGTTGLDSGRLLTHFRFHPVQKTSEQRIQIVYTLRVRA